MEEILAKIPDIIQIIALVGMVLTLVATVVVRFTPSKLDDEVVAGLAGKLIKVLQWLPTIGVNPRTKALEEAYKEIKGA